MERVINLFGEVGKEITAKKFIAELKRLGSGEPIEVNIYSEGGSVYEALAIYDYVATTSGSNYKFNATVNGLAASAGTIIALALGAKMGANAYFMIHNAYSPEKDPSSGTLMTIDDLNKKLAAIYSRHTGKPLAEIVEMMEAETMMDALTAKAMGFTKEVSEAMAIAANMTGIEDWKGVIENRTITEYPQVIKVEAKKALDFIAKIGKGDLSEIDLARARQLANGEPISQHTFDVIAQSDLPIYGGANNLLQTSEDKIFNKLKKHIDMNFNDIKNFITQFKPKAKFEFTLEDGTAVYVESDTEPQIGDVVYLEDGTVAPDADHKYNGMLVTTVDGVITEINPIEDMEIDAKLKQAVAYIEQLMADNEAKEATIQAQATELETLKAQGAPAVQAKRVPVATAKVTPKADASPSKDKVITGEDVMASRFKAHMRTKGVSIN
jgi:ATP-dependent protease ClpP protease subunit